MDVGDGVNLAALLAGFGVGVVGGRWLRTRFVRRERHPEPGEWGVVHRKRTGLHYVYVGRNGSAEQRIGRPVPHDDPEMTQKLRTYIGEAIDLAHQRNQQPLER
jgi:hypothetical protein